VFSRLTKPQNQTKNRIIIIIYLPLSYLSYLITYSSPYVYPTSTVGLDECFLVLKFGVQLIFILAVFIVKKFYTGNLSFCSTVFLKPTFV